MTKDEIKQITRATLVQILRRGSIVDSDDPEVVDVACEEQERIARRIEKMIRDASLMTRHCR